MDFGLRGFSSFTALRDWNGVNGDHVFCSHRIHLVRFIVLVRRVDSAVRDQLLFWFRRGSSIGVLLFSPDAEGLMNHSRAISFLETRNGVVSKHLTFGVADWQKW